MKSLARVGSVVYATDQGLGYLARDFYNNGILSKVLIKAHTKRVNHPDWYREEDQMESFSQLCEEVDIILFFETPFHWEYIVEARKRGVKTVLMPMYECTPFPFRYEPDYLIAPSKLDLEFYQDKGVENIEYIPVPVDVEWRERDRAKVFVHNAGNGGLGGRNGTGELITAMEYVKSDIELIIRTQTPALMPHTRDDPRITFRLGTRPFDELYAIGDVFIFPEKFNGLSLPLQEAFASGMLVMTTNRYPNNAYLPTDPLIPVKEYTKERISVDFDAAVLDPVEIAKTIDEWYDAPITDYSYAGKQYGIDNSWQNLKPRYDTMFTNLID